ncbi:hypothetical protein KR067_004934, partial [Drosophila pandora]
RAPQHVCRGPSTSKNSATEDTNVPPPPKRLCRHHKKNQCHDPYKCPVCLECVSHREPVSTNCGHVFCRECIEGAIRSMHKCPMCNKDLTEDQFLRIYL